MAPVALKKLTASQTAREAEIRTMLTRLLNKPRASLNRGIVQMRLDLVKDIWAEIRKTHSEIISRDDAETDAYTVDNWFERIQGIYENALDEVLTLLTLFDKPDGDSSSVGDQSVSLDTGGAAKLPRIPLPTFSGRYEDWASFCDLFTTLVHDVPRSADATKLQYLKLCLKDSAAELIKDVTITSANYASTWQALKARYYNPRLIVNKLISSFMEIPYLKRELAFELRSFVDEAQRIMRTLSNLKLAVEKSDFWPVFLLSERLDPETRKLWESELSDKEAVVDTVDCMEIAETSKQLPKFTDLIKFLEKRAQALGMIAADRKAEKRRAPTPIPSTHTRKIFHASSSRPIEFSKCLLCSGAHHLSKCFKLRDKDHHDRFSTVKRLHACFNCLGSHKASVCASSGRCSLCKGKHHTLLHLRAQGNSQNAHRVPQSSQSNNKVSGDPSIVSLHAAMRSVSKRKIILATAQVRVIGPGGVSTIARALLDQGSETSFVSESIVQLLRLAKKKICINLTGVGDSSAGTVRSTTELCLKSLSDKNFELHTSALVLPRLTSQIPFDTITGLNLTQFAGMNLADPQFNVLNKVDVILGADVYGRILLNGMRRFMMSQLVAQETVFGWVVSGPVQLKSSGRAEKTLKALHCVSTEELNQTLSRFWTIEDITSMPHRVKPNDAACEKLFKESHIRDRQGRYEVRLPVKSSLPLVAAETRQMAIRSLATMHRRFARDPKLASAYQEFMQEYERLGHMTRIRESEKNQLNAWYLPHHAVVTSVNAWKLRVVFDASRRTREGYFLNDYLHTGAPLQNDLSLILLNWRRYAFVFTSDVVKIFRQIKIHLAYQDRQRIVWAPTPDAPPIDYRLTTVTYGTACAPFFAIRTLLQLVEDEGHKFPLGAACLKFETYVDDTFAGADELSTAVQKRIELTNLLELAGIRLDKWAANHSQLLPSSVQSGSEKQIEIDQTVKALGIHWSPSQDKFRFNIADVAELSAASTKRTILSNVTRLFDPLGWLAPITIKAQILMQDLWIQKCEWDTPVSSEIRERWYAYCKSLADLPSLSIDRWLGVTASRSYQLHGFSDASSRAYAAVLYMRVDEGDGRVKVSLLTAKTKVLPVKTPDCAVSFIQTELPSATWAHVPSKENPADLATRGVEASELSHTDIWWNGPRWLSQSSEIVARCRRPLLNLRNCKEGKDILPDFLTSRELAQAQTIIIRLSQAQSFSNEIEILKAEKRLQKGNRLCKLNPILDQEGILRVGGRLEHSSLSFAIKHPPILAQDSALSILFARSAHHRCLHGGPTLTSSVLMQQVWIIGRKNVVKSVIHKCIICQRVKPQSAYQLMGDLPAERVSIRRPFAVSGLDYAGPIHVRTTKGRGHRAYKGYIAVFVCFTTRAIHLELVSDLTSAAFICAYRRFVGRRGICTKLYSDNATNFHGTDKELKELFRQASEFYHEVASVLANDGTHWSFIPPSAPHYGGLWEAGVKSLKHHLKRVIGDHTLTFEEVSTVLVEIEACLNSRPLGALTSDIDDLHALTPFHFIHGGASALLPEADSSYIPRNRLDRFQLQQRIRNQFWKRWSTEYLLHLQQREKWREPTENFCVGRLVLIRDDRYPPSKWPLGRILEVHPGPDGLVRVATINKIFLSRRL